MTGGKKLQNENKYNKKKNKKTYNAVQINYFVSQYLIL